MTHRVSRRLEAVAPCRADGCTVPALPAVGRDISAVAPQPAEDFETILHHITHDLRATVCPMAIVPCWIREDMQRDGQQMPEAVEEHLQTLERHAARLDRMLTDLRSRPDPPALLEIDATLDEVLASMALPPAFRVTRTGDTSSLVAPPADFRLLLRCLVENAWKHHDRDQGKITIAAGNHDNSVRMTVIDDGPGIERRHRDAVFEMMTTLRPRDEVEGSGMGLSIARKIVTCLGGTIEIAEPLAQRGTCVSVVLPQPVR